MASPTTKQRLHPDRFADTGGDSMWSLSRNAILGVVVTAGAASLATDSVGATLQPSQGRELAAQPAKNAIERPKDCIPRSQCCRICTSGQACGNWCTKAIFNCRKVGGCACDAKSVCPTQ